MKNLLVIILLILISCIILFKCNNPFKKKIEKIKQKTYLDKDAFNISQIKEAKETDTTTHEVINGVVIAEKKVAVGTEKQLNIFYKKKFDSIKKQLDIKQKQIDNILDANISAEGKITGIKVQRDDFFNYEIPFSDSFLKGYVIIDDSLRQAYVYYEGTLKLHGIMYWKRSHIKGHGIWKFIFGVKSYRQVLYSDINNISIDSIQSIKV